MSSVGPRNDEAKHSRTTPLTQLQEKLKILGAKLAVQNCVYVSRGALL